MGGYMNILSSSAKQEDLLAAEMLSNLEDITFVIYVDEVTGEIVSYEMDLSSLMISLLSGLGENDSLPVEALEIFKSLKMNMVMDVLNVNEAKDFDIPKEALNAPLADNM